MAYKLFERSIMMRVREVPTRRRNVAYYRKEREENRRDENCLKGRMEAKIEQSVKRGRLLVVEAARKRQRSARGRGASLAAGADWFLACDMPHLWKGARKDDIPVHKKQDSIRTCASPMTVALHLE